MTTTTVVLAHSCFLCRYRVSAPITTGNIRTVIVERLQLYTIFYYFYPFIYLIINSLIEILIERPNIYEEHI